MPPKVSGKIYILATDDNTPSGGRRVIYTLVDLLCNLGYEAYALHQTKDFRYTWFPNDTPVCWTQEIQKRKYKPRTAIRRIQLSINQLYDRLTSKAAPLVTICKEDLIVIPENRVTHITNIFPENQKVILNQNPYIFLRQTGPLRFEKAISHPSIIGWWTVSKLIDDILLKLNVTQPICRIPNIIDPALYELSKEKKRQIAYMPRRLNGDAEAVIRLLQTRGCCKDWQIVPIDNCSPTEVSRILQESLIFLSFSHREGFGLPPAEAMACGCIVIGYTGNAGNEFMTPDLCFPIDDGDLLSFAQTVEHAIARSRKSELEEIGSRAAEYIIDTYSKKAASKALITAMEQTFHTIDHN